MCRTAIWVVIFSTLFVAPASSQEQSGDSIRMVEMELVIAEFTAADGNGDRGPASTRDNPADRLKKLEEQGKVEALMRVALSGLNGTQAMVQIGERVPIATGRTSFPTGARNAPPGDRGGFGANTTYSFHDMGSIVNATPTIQEDGSILIKLEIERSRLAKPSPESTSDIESRSRTVTVTARSTIRVENGRTVLVTGAQHSDGGDPGELIILASARVSE